MRFEEETYWDTKQKLDLWVANPISAEIIAAAERAKKSRSKQQKEQADTKAQQEQAAEPPAQRPPGQLREALPRGEKAAQAAQQGGIEQSKGQGGQGAGPGGGAAQGGGGTRDQAQDGREQGCRQQKLRRAVGFFHGSRPQSGHVVAVFDLPLDPEA